MKEQLTHSNTDATLTVALKESDNSYVDYLITKPALIAELQGEMKQMFKGRIRPTSRNVKCPQCSKKFTDIPKHGFICQTCKTKPERYMVDIHWNGKRPQICSDKTGQPLDTYQRAYNLLSTIQSEIDNHKFDPANYIKTELSQFYFSTKIQQWIDYKEAEKLKGKIAPSTLKTYKTYVRNFYKPFFGDKDIRDITSSDMKGFYQQLPNNLSLKYQSSIVKTLAVFFNTFDSRELPYKPSFKDIKISVPRRVPEWIDRPAQDDIISHIDGSKNPIYIFLTRQGIRPSEGRALKIKDIDLKEGTVTIQRTFSEHELTEINKEKDVAPRLLNPQLIPMLKDLCKNRFPEEFLFINHNTGRPYGRKKLNEIWNDACKKAGIKIKLYNATRHSIGSQASRAGVSADDIADILHHCDSRISKKHYINSDELEKQKVVFDRINNVTKLKKKNVNRP